MSRTKGEKPQRLSLIVTEDDTLYYIDGSLVDINEKAVREQMVEIAAAGTPGDMHICGTMHLEISAQELSFAEATKRWREAVEWLRQADRLGHIGARRMLGCLYACMDIIPRDAEEGLRWLEELIKADDDDGNVRFLYLVHTYAQKGGLEESPALQMLSPHAHRNTVCCFLALLCQANLHMQKALDDPKNITAAMKLYRKAFKQGAKSIPNLRAKLSFFFPSVYLPWRYADRNVPPIII